jgi:hypothetical protein
MKAQLVGPTRPLVYFNHEITEGISTATDSEVKTKNGLVNLFFAYKPAEKIENYQRKASSRQVVRSFDIRVTFVTACDFSFLVNPFSMVTRNSRALYSARINSSVYERDGCLESSFVGKLTEWL